VAIRVSGLYYKPLDEEVALANPEIIRDGSITIPHVRRSFARMHEIDDLPQPRAGKPKSTNSMRISFAKLLT
jgi:hypothetical protein